MTDSILRRYDPDYEFAATVRGYPWQLVRKSTGALLARCKTRDPLDRQLAEVFDGDPDLEVRRR